MSDSQVNIRSSVRKDRKVPKYGHVQANPARIELLPILRHDQVSALRTVSVWYRKRARGSFKGRLVRYGGRRSRGG